MSALAGIAPAVAWAVAGSLKLAINSARRRRLAWDEMGYGGFPSTHSAIVGAAVAAVLLEGGAASPVFPVALALALIVLLDATGLRRHVGRQAARLNQLAPDESPLRERLGHRLIDVAGGLGVGGAVALALSAA